MADNDLKNKSAEASPETLFDITLKYIVDNIEILYEEFYNEENKQDVRLRGDYKLPSELCERLLEAHNTHGYPSPDRFSRLFSDLTKTKLKYVTLRNCPITDEGLRNIVNHDLVSLQLLNCAKLTAQSLACINEHTRNLVCLTVGSDTGVVPSCVGQNGWIMFRTIGHVIQAPLLRKLTIRDINISLSILLSNLKQLTYLDLSQCGLSGEFVHLEQLKSLQCLILYNVSHLQEAVPHICKLGTLQLLDLSQSGDRHSVIYEDENRVLSTIVHSLPHLVHLDISGTNLAGTGVAQPDKTPSNNPSLSNGGPSGYNNGPSGHNNGPSGYNNGPSGYNNGMSNTSGLSDIPGLTSRMCRPLDFLGLYGTLHAACQRHDIPAKIISGDSSEAQILVAAQAYQERPELLTRVLNDLYHLLRYETCCQVTKALEAVLSAMDKHVACKHIQISGSATLFYIVKGKDKSSVSLQIRQHIIRTLLNGMAKHLEDETMMRNGCLTLCQFKIPQDVLFQYEKLVRILLHGVSDTEQEGFVQRIAIYLLNSLACQVDGTQKQCLGDMGAISKMLWIINNRVERHICDDVLEVAWSTMWNVTDETADNCRRFLDGKGMDYFLQCLIQFPAKEELLRNMMGLLGNVAEVRTLRYRLMTSQFIAVFANLLDSCSDGIEVSYNAAGVLSHLASDGPDIWTISEPKRCDVLTRMVNAIERWDLSTERNINYRSFEPILYLIRSYETPECQHWAAWALANLTRVYPMKYCSLVELEGGLALLKELLNHPQPYARVKELASIVIENCAKHKESVGDAMVLEG